MYPVVDLTTIEDIEQFTDLGLSWTEKTPLYTDKYERKTDSAQLLKNIVRVVAFISNPKEYEEELQSLYKTARTLHPRNELRIGLVTNPSIAKHFKEQKGVQWFEENTINSLVLLRLYKGDKPTGKVYNYNISTRSKNMYQWINDQSLDHFMELTGYSYKIIVILNKPFFVAFLEDGSKGPTVKSQELYNIVSRLANSYPKFEFTFTSNDFYKKKKESLGITWSHEPSLTFNFGPSTEQSIPFPEDLAINEQNVKDYIDRILDGTLAPEKFKNKKLLPQKEKRSFGDAVLTEGTDVLLLVFDSSRQDRIGHMAEIDRAFKKAARRFKDLGIHSVKLNMFDAKSVELPDGIGSRDHLPKVFFFPAYRKQPPYHQFYDLSTEQIMKQVEAYADIKFTLPEKAHMTREEIEAKYARERAGDL